MRQALIRQRFVHALLGTTLAGAGLAFLLNGFSGWPLVAYNMYARLPLEHPRTYLFAGQTKDGHTIYLSDDSFFRPYLRQDYTAMLNSHFPREAASLDPLWLAFEETSRSGAHPPLSSLTIYRLSWKAGEAPRKEFLGEKRWP